MRAHIELSRGVVDRGESTAMLRFSADGMVVAASPTAARLFGYESVERLLRASARGELISLRRLNARDWVRRILAAGEVVVEDRMLQRQSGVDFPCRLVVGPWCQHGRAVGVQAILEDRTSQEGIRTFVSAIMDALPNPVFVKDSSHRWLALNRAYCELVQCEPEELLGKSDFDLHPPEQARHFWDRDDVVISTGATDEVEEPWTAPDGRVHTFITRKSRHIVDGQPFLVGIITDITERKRDEEALRRSWGELDQRVQERTRDLELSNQELQLLHQRSGEFISILSHELRNPLAAICNALYLLKRNQSLDAPARFAAGVIDRQAGHLNRLVSDLLEVTRVSRGRIELKRSHVDLAQLVRQTLQDHRSTLDRRHLIEDLPAAPVWIEGDPTRLVQIVGNLLDNAAKFTPEGGQVRLSLRELDERVVFEIADTGVGIDAETLARLFQPFAQADRSLERSKGGLGLGLALVKGLVELHGGHITAHSEGPNRGTRFEVVLPRAEQQRAQEVTETAPPPRARAASRRVLLIEDERDTASTLSNALQLAGHEVRIAHDGIEGLEQVRALRPEVILCDIGLPGIDGYALARALHEELRDHPALLVALTGYAGPEDERQAREAGFARHLAKPVDIERLVGLLAELPDA